MGDPVGRKPLSAFCRRNMAIFRHLLDRYEADPFAREVFETLGDSDDPAPRSRNIHSTFVPARAQRLDARWQRGRIPTTRHACLLRRSATPVPEGYELYIGKHGIAAPVAAAAFVELPAILDHLQPDDVIGRVCAMANESACSGVMPLARTASCLPNAATTTASCAHNHRRPLSTTGSSTTRSNWFAYYPRRPAESASPAVNRRSTASG